MVVVEKIVGQHPQLLLQSDGWRSFKTTALISFLGAVGGVAVGGAMVQPVRGAWIGLLAGINVSWMLVADLQPSARPRPPAPTLFFFFGEVPMPTGGFVSGVVRDSKMGLSVPAPFQTYLVNGFFSACPSVNQEDPLS